MTEQHTPTPHPFAKEITEWLQDTSQQLWCILEGSANWYSVKENQGFIQRVLNTRYVHSVHVGPNPPPKEAVYFDRNHYTINASVTDTSLVLDTAFVVDLQQPTGVRLVKDSDMHIPDECFKRGFVYLTHEDALMKAKHLADKIGLGLAM